MILGNPAVVGQDVMNEVADHEDERGLALKIDILGENYSAVRNDIDAYCRAFPHGLFLFDIWQRILSISL